MHLKDYQKKLFPYAYNILGSYDDAQDAIQDVLLKYQLADKSHIENENNYLIKGVINQAINIKKRNSKTASADTKISLPEPISTDNADYALNGKEVLSYSLLVLLDSLTPRERAVFILKEAFEYSHDEIAQSLQITIQNSRKLLSRAKLRIGKPGKKQMQKNASSGKQLERYIVAIQNGDIKLLEQILSQDITAMTDGGSISIVTDIAKGKNTVSQLMAYVYKTYQTRSEIKIGIINHQPAIFFYTNGQLINCQVFNFNAGTGKIENIYSIVNPKKLKNLKITS